MQLCSKTIYTFEEIIELHRKSGGDKFYIPNVKEHEGKLFILTEIPLSDIPIDNFTTLEQYEEDDCLMDSEHVIYLVNAYRKGEDIPPIVLTKSLKIIDGFHRTSAEHYLNFSTIKCFIEQ